MDTTERVEVVAPPSRTGVIISRLRFKGATGPAQADEYVEISNRTREPVDLSGWKVSADDPGQTFTFPSGTLLKPASRVRVYTQEVHPETGGYRFGSKRAVFNDRQDVAKLYDPDGRLISHLGYAVDDARHIPLIEQVKKRLCVPRLTVQADGGEIALQGQGAAVSFSDALHAAIRSFLEDGRDIESPVGMVTNDPRSYGLPEDADEEAIREKVRELLDEQRTSLTLLARGETPEHGERVDDFWIFRLRADHAFGDMMQWALIDRQARQAPYNYGFN